MSPVDLHIHASTKALIVELDSVDGAAVSDLMIIFQVWRVMRMMLRIYEDHEDGGGGSVVAVAAAAVMVVAVSWQWWCGSDGVAVVMMAVVAIVLLLLSKGYCPNSL